MKVQIIKPEQQATGTFDDGKIVSQKPIGFSGEGSTINRLGSLFYWSWSKSTAPSGIGLHPHQGFEIITYAIKGKAYHRDTLGTESAVTEGGAQLMQTGSGVSHAEELKEPSEMFQIWFEPDLTKALQQPPTYLQYKSEEFPVMEKEGVTIKTVLGSPSPMIIVTDAKMWDLILPKGTSYTHSLTENRTLAGLALKGNGIFTLDANTPTDFEYKDFVIIQPDQDREVVIQAKEQSLRLFLIEIPNEVDYQLYKKP